MVVVAVLRASKEVVDCRHDGSIEAILYFARAPNTRENLKFFKGSKPKITRQAQANRIKDKEKHRRSKQEILGGIESRKGSE